MKIEFLLAGSEDCPLIRLFGFSCGEAIALHAVVQALGEREIGQVDLNEALRVVSIGGCHLVLKTGTRDQGVVETDQPNAFEGILTSDSWDNVSGLIEPFCEAANGFQWLDRTGEIALLISVDGRW